MGFRFRKSVRLMPGVRLNLSKGGISTSLGGRGGSINIGKRGVRATAGIPGSGLSYSQQLFTAPKGPSQSAVPPAQTTPSGKPAVSVGLVAGLMAILGLGFCSVGGDEPAAPAQPSATLNTPPAKTARMTVTAPNLNCRANPDVSGALVAQFAKGAVVTVQALEMSGWRWIVMSGEHGCWAAAKYLAPAQGD